MIVSQSGDVQDIDDRDEYALMQVSGIYSSHVKSLDSRRSKLFDFKLTKIA